MLILASHCFILRKGIHCLPNILSISILWETLIVVVEADLVEIPVDAAVVVEAATDRVVADKMKNVECSEQPVQIVAVIVKCHLNQTAASRCYAAIVSEKMVMILGHLEEILIMKSADRNQVGLVRHILINKLNC